MSSLPGRRRAEATLSRRLVVASTATLTPKTIRHAATLQKLGIKHNPTIIFLNNFML
jgi:hypothetical protein